MCPAVPIWSGTLTSRSVLDGVTSRGSLQGTGEEDCGPRPASSGHSVPCEGAPASGRVNLGEGSTLRGSGQVSCGEASASRPELDRATDSAASHVPPEKPSDLTQHADCSFLPEDGGDKARMGQAATAAAAPVSKGRPPPITVCQLPLAGVGLSPRLRMNEEVLAGRSERRHRS
jgi:hypothetical protein